MLAQIFDEPAHLGKGLAHRRQVGDLAANVTGHARRMDRGQGFSLGIEPQGLGKGDPELVFRLAGRNLGVAPGADIGIDADGDGLAFAQAGGDLGQKVQFRLRLDIDFTDAGLDGKGQLRRRLADPGKDDPRRRNASGKGAANLAFRHCIGPGPLGGESA